MKEPKFVFGTVTVPDGTKGDWKIDTFTISKTEADRYNFSIIMGGYGWMRVEPGTYKRLSRGNTVVMSNTPMEVMTNRQAYNDATGRVLINGLGLGMLLEGLLHKPDVTYVRVIEKEQDVIDLVAPHFAKYGSRVEIVHADALDYKPGKDEHFDYAWHDIWDTISSDNLDEMATLGRRYGKRRSDKQGWWARDIIRADVRSANRW